ncbi:hypothetical protein WN943_028517 [Citrus x changshan-huyou]
MSLRFKGREMKANPDDDDDDDEKKEKKTKNGCGSGKWKPNEKLYGSTLEIASVSFGCERGFLLKIKQVNHPKIEELMTSLRASA